MKTKNCSPLTLLGFSKRLYGQKIRLFNKEAFLDFAVSRNIMWKEECKPSPQLYRQGSVSEPVNAHGFATYQWNIINRSQFGFIDSTGWFDKIS